MNANFKIDRTAIFRDAWSRARYAAAAAGESVRLHIGAAMRTAWSEAKAAAAAMVPQAVQQQQAQAATPIHTAVDAEIHTVENLGGALDELARVVRDSYLAQGLSHNKVLSSHLAEYVETSRRYITHYPSAHAYADALQTTSQAYGFLMGIGLTDDFPVVTRACNLTRDAAVAWAEPLQRT